MVNLTEIKKQAVLYSEDYIGDYNDVSIAAFLEGAHYVINQLLTNKYKTPITKKFINTNMQLLHKHQLCLLDRGDNKTIYDVSMFNTGGESIILRTIESVEELEQLLFGLGLNIKLKYG